MAASKPKQEFITPVARLVNGHPMILRDVVDDRTGEPKLNPSTNEKRTEIYIAIAIPKGQEQSWTQTEWGAKIWVAGTTDWPNGEYNAPTFAWKVTDGDSAVPNRKGKKPIEREGWAGNWIVHLKTEIPYPCHHVGKYDAIQQIRNTAEIKCGDYVRVFVSAVGNAPSQSPGVYLNPLTLELNRAGELIVTEGSVDVKAVFGANPAPNQPIAPPAHLGGVVPPQAANIVPPPVNAAPVTPAHDLVPPPVANVAPPPPAPVKQMAPGCPYTYDQLVAAKYTDAQMIAQGYLLP